MIVKPPRLHELSQARGIEISRMIYVDNQLSGKVKRIKEREKIIKKILPGGESNPALARDRRVY